jgi:8-oxo-dGTP pyrophosphatase MutT (NUDIX family)
MSAGKPISGLLDHICNCRRRDMSRFRPFHVGGERVGWVKHELAAWLESQGRTFEAADGGLSLSLALADFDSRSRAMAEIAAAMVTAGRLRRLRGEDFAVAPAFGRPPLFKLDRIAVGHFGVKAYGVHMNGFVRRADGIHLWIGRRARDKSVAPGKLDHLVAGGQPYGLGIRENLAKECAEEAAIPPALAAQARPAGIVSYMMEHDGGLRDDVLFVFDLELPPDFAPRNTDGEIEEFMLWPAARALREMETTDNFKFNVNLVLIDFLIRHGLIGPERPDYLALLAGLRLGAAR